MLRKEIQTALEEAAAISHHHEFVVVGSLAVLDTLVIWVKCKFSGMMMFILVSYQHKAKSAMIATHNFNVYPGGYNASRKMG